MLEFGILGPLEARADGEPVDLGPYKQRELLALLLLHVDRVVSTDRILEELWGDDAPGKEKALWVHVSRLRSALEPGRVERGQHGILVTRDHGYALRTSPDSVDAHRFEAIVRDAGARLRDDPEAASAQLRAGLALWRGAALEDFAYADFARAEADRLEDLRLDALELRIDADLRRGQAAELVGELEGLVHRHPLREQFVAHLMRALYRAGRQAEALRSFQRYRRGLAEELGVDPSPELRRLEEQILLHDPRLAPERGPLGVTVANPFKGLHPFHESDADDFFGRDRLVAAVIERVSSGDRLVALVGPSGSGKSSVARAGVVPALRKGAVAGSDGWLIASMVPGAHPFAELEAALARSTLDAPPSLDAQLADPRLGLLRAALRLLPDAGRLVLVIDQFEELFTLTEDEGERRRFVDNLVAALEDTQGRIVVVVTLRADAYHLPLGHAAFAARLGPAVLNVLELSPDELEEAAEGPAARRGVTLEPAVIAALLTDVIGEPGSLPIFQYALTELFERRDGDRLTAAAYDAMGGVRGVLSRRADDAFHRMTVPEQEATRQLFLRLVTITADGHWGRRRVPASELVAMELDVVTMESAIDQLGRLLAFDRDHASGQPTVEVAHEALLSEWDRLRGWIEDGRVDVARAGALQVARSEWEAAGRDADYLLAGRRLAEYERWRAESTMRLTRAEQEFLDAAIARRDAADEAETARAAREAGLVRRARRGRWALGAVAVALAATAVVVVVSRPEPEPQVAMLTFGFDDSIDRLLASGFERAGRELAIDPVLLDGPFSDIGGQLDEAIDAGTDLVLVTDGDFYADVAAAAARHPDVTWAFVDPPADVPASVTFAEQEGSFLVGAAAALTSETGTVGFLGGHQFGHLERFRAGFEAGARAVDPDIEILAQYVGLDASAFGRDDLAAAATRSLYQDGADVVFHAAGPAGGGVFAAAVDQSERLGRHLWAIGVDADEYFDRPARQQEHVLTSMVKRFDVAVVELARDYLDGDLGPTGRVLTLADGAVGYSTSGGHLDPSTVAVLERLKAEIVAGTRSVPSAPSGELRPPEGIDVAGSVTVRFDGTTCRTDAVEAEEGDVVRIDFVNTTPGAARLDLSWRDLPVVGIAAPAGGTGVGYAALRGEAGHLALCGPEPFAATNAVPGPDLDLTVE